MANRSMRVQRVYKNSAGEILRIDTVGVSGWLRRSKAFQFGEPDTVVNAQGYTVKDYGDFEFHQNGGIQLSIENFNVTTDRTVTEIEIIGGYSSLGAAPNYTEFTWEYGIVDMSSLPQVGDSV